MNASIRVSLLTAALFAVPCQAQNMLRNPGFENGGLAGWVTFGNIFAESTNPGIMPRTGRTLAKMFGQFTGNTNVGGIFQSFPAAPGDSFTIDCWSRHWSGDPLTGSSPTGNSMVMKIAFFDSAQAEIGSNEVLILDGTFPTDVWINNPAVSANAPANTVEVQALVLFIQPGVDGGAGQVDDVIFTGTPNIPPYPGTGEDLLLATGIGPGGTSAGKGNYVRTALAGDFLECNVSSPGGKYAFSPYILFTQPFVTGNPPPTIVPSLYLDPSKPIFLLVTGTGLPPFGAALIGPAGASTFYQIPAGLVGMSAVVQAVVGDPTSANTVYAASDAHEIQFK